MRDPKPGISVGLGPLKPACCSDCKWWRASTHFVCARGASTEAASKIRRCAKKNLPFSESEFVRRMLPPPPPVYEPEESVFTGARVLPLRKARAAQEKYLAHLAIGMLLGFCAGLSIASMFFYCYERHPSAPVELESKTP